MKTRTAFLSVGCVAWLCACGGADTNIPDAADDTGTADTGTGMDGSGGQDTGTDGGGGMDTGGSDAGNLNVAAVPCVVLWLDAAKGVTQTNNQVTGWADQTSNMNNAQQAIMARQPTLVASAINAKPAIHFNKGNAGTGNMVTIADNATLQFGHNDFAVFVVARFDNDPNGMMTTGLGVLFSKQVTQTQPYAGPMLFANNAANTQMIAAGLTGATSAGAVATYGSAYNDNMPRAYAVRRTGAVVDIRVNGATVGMATQNGAVDVSSPGVGARIGADGDASYHRLNGDVAEVVACKGTMAANDLAAIDAYFKAKYNL